MKALFMTSVLLLSTPAWAQKNRDVIIYDDPNFKGVHEVLNESDPDLRDNVVSDNQLQSIRVPPGATVTLFEHRRYRGQSVTLTRNVNNIAKTSLGANKVSSIMVEWDDDNQRGRGQTRGQDRRQERVRSSATTDPHPLDDPAYQDKVLIFALSHFRGSWDAVDGDVSRMDRTRIGDNRMSSIAIPDGYEVTLYEFIRYNGKSEVLRADDTDLGNNEIGLNQVSSMRVTRIPERRYSQPSEPVYTEPDEPIAERGGVVLYRDAFFRGESMRAVRSIPDLGETVIGNDGLSSLRVPKGWEAILFEHENYRGKSFSVTYDYSNLAANRFGDDTASSVQIRRLVEQPPPEAPLPPERGLVTLYEHDDYRGVSIAIDGDIPDLGKTKLGNDRLSSFRVPPGYRVIFYQHENFQGVSQSFEEDVPDMDKTDIGNDEVSSVRVVPIRRR